MTDLKIIVGESFDAVLSRAEAAERGWRAGAITGDAATYVNFASWEHLTSVLTPKRLELLRTLHHSPTASVRRLAKTLGRSYANVHADIEALTAAGLVERGDEGLRAEYDGISTHIAL